MRARVRRSVHLPRTLRGRLVALLVAVLTIGFAAAALVTVLVVRRVLVDRLDAQLRAAGDRFAVGLEHDDRDADNGGGRYGAVQGQLAGTLGARLLHGRVTTAAIVGDNNTSDVVPAAARVVLARLRTDTKPQTITLPGLGSYRVTVQAGRDNDLQVTGLPFEPVEDTIDQLVLIEVVVFAVALLIVVLASTGLVRLMLRPLARMAGTAAEVSALPLESGGVSLPHRVPTRSRGSEVDALAAAFNAMLAQVESALTTRAASEEQLRRFVADASHELRTPVAVVQSHAEFALRAGGDAAADLPEDVVHSLRRIEAQAGRMGHLVEDLLLLARLDAGRPLARDRVDVTRLVLDAVDDVRATAAGHRWRLHLPTQSTWIVGDPHALAQAVSNVLTNAALHTPDGTSVSVSVRYFDTDPATIRISVADDGPGMPSDLTARAFDRFVRGGRPRSVHRGSSGLGLPIVAAILDAHGGTVDLSSSPTGTTLHLDLPANGVPPDADDADDADEAYDGFDADDADDADEADEADDGDDADEAYETADETADDDPVGAAGRAATRREAGTAAHPAG